MSLKIIADAKRIVDRGQDLSLRVSNRPYSVESDPLTEQKALRGSRANAMKESRVQSSLLAFINEILLLENKYIGDNCYSYEVTVRLSTGDEALIADNSGIVHQVLKECATQVVTNHEKPTFKLILWEYSGGIDLDVIKKMGFDAFFDPENIQSCCISKSFSYDPDGLQATPQVERQFQNLSRYLLRVASSL